MDTHETIRKRIRKLLNLADGSNHAGEIENALRFAQKLMDAHQLTRTQILDDPEAGAAAGEQMAREAAFAGGKNLAYWEGTLAQAVCRIVGSVQVYSDRHAAVRSTAGLYQGDLRTGPSESRAAYQFYGIGEDVALAVELFTDTRTTICTMARLKFGGVYRGPGRSYCEGFASSLYRKTKEQAQERPAQCTAIIHTTEAKAEAWLAKTHDIKLGKTGGGRGGRYHANASAEGRADGQRCGFSANRRPKLAGGTDRAALPG